MILTRRSFGLSVCGLAVAALAAPRTALALAQPTGTVLLTVSGRIGATNGPAGAVFDRSMLDALPQGRFVTATKWDPERRTYTGPWLRDVLNAAGATGRRLKVTALNDYSVTMPVPADQPHQPILASRIDEQPIPARGKGPLWVMYDFGSGPTVYNPDTDRWAVWNVRSIEVID